MECKHALAVGSENGVRYIRIEDYNIEQNFWALFNELDAEAFDYCPFCGVSLAEIWEDFGGVI